jgi:2-polyprenyl-3-methyl-5-hydroxy-6-metoxy-1,4-benzoquinol methylase
MPLQFVRKEPGRALIVDAERRAFLSCPACCGELGVDWDCQGCGMAFAAPDGVPALRLPGDARTETVRDFYTETPFPNYPPGASLSWLRSRADRSEFARLLDAAIPPGARVVEVGCGTGQMSLYLARRGRQVVGADLTRASLLLAAEAAARFGIDGVSFVETDLTRPALRRGAFDVVYCSGVLHHTPDPRAAFARVAELARPGGLIILGLYNAVARLPLRLRRVVARLTSERWIPFDPVLRDRAAEPERRAAWLRDQYQHPEEHRHTLGEVRRWFAQNQVTFVRSYPPAFSGGEPTSLLEPEEDSWMLGDWMTQLGWIGSIGSEGGLFITVGRAS